MRQQPIPCGNGECRKPHFADSLYCSWRCEHIVEARMARNLAARSRTPGAKAAELQPSAATFSADATQHGNAALRVRETGPGGEPSSVTPGPVLFSGGGRS